MNDDQHSYKEQGCDDESPGEEPVQTPRRERDGRQEEKPAKSLFQQWRDLDIDRRIESGVAVIGLVIGVVVAFVAFNQLSAMREQTDAMKKQLAEMSKEQRPWLLKTVNKELPTELPVIKVGERIMWSCFFENYGKTPAINVIQKGKVLFGKDSLKKVIDNYFGEIRTSQTSGIVMGPNDPRYRTFASDEVVRESDIASIHSDGGVVLLYRIEYRDITGNDYFTEVCQSILATGAVLNCGPHNRVK